MKILITESQRKMILTENVLDELTRKISNISESGKEVIETASQQLGTNLKSSIFNSRSKATPEVQSIIDEIINSGKVSGTQVARPGGAAPLKGIAAINYKLDLLRQHAIQNIIINPRSGVRLDDLDSIATGQALKPGPRTVQRVNRNTKLLAGGAAAAMAAPGSEKSSCASAAGSVISAMSAAVSAVITIGVPLESVRVSTGVSAGRSLYSIPAAAIADAGIASPLSVNAETRTLATAATSALDNSPSLPAIASITFSISLVVTSPSAASASPTFSASSSETSPSSSAVSVCFSESLASA
jgi:hypothetical protein